MPVVLVRRGANDEALVLDRIGRFRRLRTPAEERAPKRHAKPPLPASVTCRRYLPQLLAAVTYLRPLHLLGIDHTPRCFPKHPSKRHPERTKPMPRAYWVPVYRSISDPQKVAAYAKLAAAATGKFGARYIARGPPNEGFEAGQKERIVISEFPS